MRTYTATFGPEDFERWWLEGMTRDDKLTQEHMRELFSNCLYLARAESREMTQTEPELKSAIGKWAARWNGDIDART